MQRVPLMGKEIESETKLAVEVGTNCPMGGDGSHGGRTILRLIADNSTDLRTKTPAGLHQRMKNVEVLISGDSQCDNLIAALEFAVETLKAMRRHNAELGPITDVPKVSIVN